ncbi:SDR family NAD(P)-dependent oxidoreductase [Tautonia plasticadhaerens]|uniref:3-oxoacyl-[acyl-carrier-protein] reductase FabG n=1 Tax=Tautonia plasticadhaerens TaxID=2527974 RepID=A0A518GX42_9BACT|nr:SDR family oxidoreductase [Tautonia plasticadhaerens]QDV33147.1 3-oxoacyl-[acyl-carrier-protein] reductase FabG [Tautonia plasticadhaerens]
MRIDLGGEVAMVFGAARGIGRAIAEGFSEAGATVAYVDRSPTVGFVAGQYRRHSGRKTAAFVADVTDAELMRQVADDAFRDLGRVDHLVYAAAVGSGKFGMPFWNLEPGDWDRVLRVNLLGAVHVAHAFGPLLAEAGRGSMTMIGSVSGQIGSQTDPPYSASKAALINFAQCAARDLAPSGVRVNTINPGMVDTPLNRSVYEAWAATQPRASRQGWEDWSSEKIRRLVPLGRWQEPEDIASMAVFLASPMARNVTGQTINVDGGYVMHW